jgi:hypothetical protein
MWSAVSMKPWTKYDTADQWASMFDLLWLLLKGISKIKSYIGKGSATIHATHWMTIKKVDFTIEYLCKYEAICKIALTRGSGAQKELFDEKNRRSKMP